MIIFSVINLVSHGSAQRDRILKSFQICKETARGCCHPGRGEKRLGEGLVKCGRGTRNGKIDQQCFSPAKGRIARAARPISEPRTQCNLLARDGGGKSTGIEPSLGNMQFILVEIVVSLERVDMTPALSNSWGK